MPPKKKVVTKPKLDVKLEQDIKTKNKAIHKRSFLCKYSGDTNKNITYKDAKKIYNTFIEDGINPRNVYVIAMVDRPYTLKSLTEDDFKDWDSEEYYSNRVADPGVFLNHFQWVRIVVLE